MISLTIILTNKTIKNVKHLHKKLDTFERSREGLGGCAGYGAGDKQRGFLRDVSGYSERMFEELSRSRLELFFVISLFCHRKAREITTIAIGSGSVRNGVSGVAKTRGLPERFFVVRGINENAVRVGGFEVRDAPVKQYSSLFSHGEGNLKCSVRAEMR
jgi:hypothetical protein